MYRLLVVLLCVVLACSKPDEVCRASIVAPITGRVVSTHDPCMGIVVQRIWASPSYSSLMTTFTDDKGNTYDNVFVVSHVCEMLEEDVAWLSDPDNVLVQFYFSFAVEGPDACTRCTPNVTLPNSSSKISINREPCNKIY